MTFDDYRKGVSFNTEPIIICPRSLPSPYPQAPLALPPDFHSITLDNITEESDPNFDDTASNASCDNESLCWEEKAEVCNRGNAGTPTTQCEIDHRDIYPAAGCGDVGTVQRLLDAGADIELETANGLSPLSIAIVEEQVEVAKTLLARGAKVHHRVQRLPILVHAAAIPNKGTELMQLLLDHGAVLSSISGPDRKTPLHWAASFGVAESIDFLINKGLDLEARCANGRTPLHLAATAGHTRAVKVLLTHGANEHATSNNGATALALAACGGHAEMVKCLLCTSISIDSIDKLGYTALSLASLFGHNEIVKLLLNGGADINGRSTDVKECIPAMAAACSNHIDVLKTLIKNDCDLSLRSARGHNVLEVALLERQVDAVRVLLSALGGESYPTESVALEIALASGHTIIKSIIATASIMYSYMEVTTKTPDKSAWLRWVLRQGGELIKPKAMTSLMHAALEDGDMTLLSALIHHGCDINRCLESGHTPLSYAVGHRNINLMHLLLDAGADPNTELNDEHDMNYTPFDHAVIDLEDGMNTEVVDVLLRTGRCRINKGRDLDSTAFSYVLSKADQWTGNVADDLAIRMINSVEDVNSDRNATGYSLLHVAVYHSRVDLIDLLLGRHADIEVVANDRYTPFILACQYRPDMIPVLIERGANIHAKFMSGVGALHVAAVEGNLESLQSLLELGLPIEGTTSEGFTPLGCALDRGQHDAAMLLLEHGASALWTTQDRLQTALHFAAGNTEEEVVLELLKQNVNIDAQDRRGWTPLIDACASGTPAIASALLDAGADMECALPNGDRPLHIALENENEGTTQRLIERGADIHCLASGKRSTLHLAAYHNLPRAAETLLERGMSTELLDEGSWTPLCHSSAPALVRLLISHGANVRYVNENGWTPLHRAVRKGETEVVKLLVAAGAGLSARTKDDGLTVEERVQDIWTWKDRPEEKKVSVKLLTTCVAQREHEKRKANLMRPLEEEQERQNEGERKRKEAEEDRRRKESEEALDGLGERFEIVDLGE